MRSRTALSDYLQLPLEAGRLARALARVVEEADAHGRARRRLTEARQRIGMLSKREREVLELLAIGSSNKLIARELTISPRTVEIHRSNMMTKLRAGHSAEAVRIWLEAELEVTIAAALDEPWVGERSSLALQPDIARMVRERSVAGLEGELEDDDGRTKESPGSRRARSS